MREMIRWFLMSLMVFLIIVLLFFFWLSSYSSTTLQRSVVTGMEKQLAHAAYLLDSSLENTELVALSLLADNRLRFYSGHDSTEKGSYAAINAYSEIHELLINQLENQEAVESISLYFNKTQSLVSTRGRGVTVEDEKFYKSMPENGWFVNENGMFFAAAYPYRYAEKDRDRPVDYSVVIELNRRNLDKIRTLTANIDHSRSILLQPDQSSISELSQLDELAVKQIKDMSKAKSLGKLTLKDEEYMYFSNVNPESKIELITYLPVAQFMEPVNKVINITIVAVCVVLGVALFTITFFYKNIMLQVNKLVQQFRTVEAGDYSTRIERIPNTEFGYVFEQFNQMMGGTQTLLKSLANEQQSRDIAELKQLQFQINPHFLYNSLAYIVSVSHNPEAVVNMSAHLADYYRYRTKSHVETLLVGEIKYAKDYLEIMAMRKDLEYSIQLDPHLEKQLIIPLILQPLVENAIEHGIEAREGAKCIQVTAQGINERVMVSVADDGYGLTAVEIKDLQTRLLRKNSEDEQSLGLWNVNQRLINHYGSEAGLLFKRNPLGGLTVYFYIQKGVQVNESLNS